MNTSPLSSQPVAQHQNTEPLPRAEQSRVTRGPLTGRVSFSVDWRCVLAIGAIMLLCFGMVAAAAPVTDNPESCSLKPIYEHTVQSDYLPEGHVQIELSEKEQEAYRMYQGLTYGAGSNEEDKLAYNQALYDIARDNLALADQHAHPADQAVLVHRARMALKMQSPSIDSEKIEELLKAEADACLRAAKCADTPAEKLSWIFRGLKEIGWPCGVYSGYGRDYGGEGHGNTVIPRGDIPPKMNVHKWKCYAAAKLWEEAGDIFSTSPKAHEPFRTDLECDGSSAGAAAHAYSNAGYFLEVGRFRSFDWRSRAALVYSKAYEHHKKINATKWSSDYHYQAYLQEKLLTVCLRLRRLDSTAISQDQIFQECMTAQGIYAEAAKDAKKSLVAPVLFERDYLVKQVSRLADAAEFAPNLEESLKLYQQGRDILEASMPFEESLLATLRCKIAETEQRMKMRDMWNLSYFWRFFS